MMSTGETVTVQEYERLKAENERLRSALIKAEHGVLQVTTAGDLFCPLCGTLNAAGNLHNSGCPFAEVNPS